MQGLKRKNYGAYLDTQRCHWRHWLEADRPGWHPPGGWHPTNIILWLILEKKTLDKRRGKTGWCRAGLTIRVAPYQCKAGNLFSYAYTGFSLSGCTFLLLKSWRFLVVSERQHNVVKIGSWSGPPDGGAPMVQPAQWIIRPWGGEETTAKKVITFQRRWQKRRQFFFKKKIEWHRQLPPRVTPNDNLKNGRNRINRIT